MPDEKETQKPEDWSERFVSMERKLNQIYTAITGDTKLGHLGLVEQIGLVRQRERDREKKRKDFEQRITNELKEYKKRIEATDAETRDMLRKQERRFVAISSLLAGLGGAIGYGAAIATGAVVKVNEFFESLQTITMFFR